MGAFHPFRCCNAADGRALQKEWTKRPLMPPADDIAVLPPSTGIMAPAVEAGKLMPRSPPCSSRRSALLLPRRQ